MTAAPATLPATQAPGTPALGPRVRSTEELYHRVVEWYDDEATLLDSGQSMVWTQLLAEDLIYRVPVRQNRLRDDPVSQFSDGMFHYDENRTTLVMKVMRLTQTASPWAENPVSRTRRFVTNVKVRRTEVPGELQVQSSLLMTRSRYTEPVPMIVSGERQDTLREDGESFKLVARLALLDQTTLGFPYQTVLI
jgi:3-phenylpropionate/cinnamic acid dioxygenase small subunit